MSYYGDFTATNAFFWNTTIDLSPFAGTDLGSTPYYIELLDAAGKKATGYIAGVGAVETLGSELITGWTNGSPAYTTFITSGKDITSAIAIATAGVGLSNNIGFNSGELIKEAFNLTYVSGEYPYLYYSQFLVMQLINGLNTLYTNILLASAALVYTFYNSGSASWSAVISGKRVTDSPSTAVHIVSSLNGTTRNWASIESGFDPNTIASYTTYVSPSGSGSSLLIDRIRMHRGRIPR